MAKFRTNHQKGGKDGGAGKMITRVGIFGGLLAALFFVFNNISGGENKPDQPEANTPTARALDFLPEGGKGKLVLHDHYALSYVEKHEQAEWVAYELSGDNLRRPWGKRIDNFRPDDKIRSGSATLNDYRGSGYDRGHLVPVADMLWDATAADQTFVMSNMSPQAHNFNNGIWRELEELTRSWAKKDKSLYVVSGPVLSLENKGSIGDNKVTIPSAYYKVLLDLNDPLKKGIAFVLPNEVNYEPLHKFALSIDEVENLTGLDFFSDLLSEAEEAELEANYNIDLWTFSQKKFDLRVNKWNNE